MTHATAQQRVLVPLYMCIYYLVVGVYQGLLRLYSGPIQALYDQQGVLLPLTCPICVSLYLVVDIFCYSPKVVYYHRKSLSKIVAAYYCCSNVCSRMLTYAHVCSRMLTYAHVCSRMLTYAHVRSRMRTYAHVCSRMLVTYADVC